MFHRKQLDLRPPCEAAVGLFLYNFFSLNAINLIMQATQKFKLKENNTNQNSIKQSNRLTLKSASCQASGLEVLSLLTRLVIPVSN